MMEAKVGSPGRGLEYQASRLMMGGWLKGLPQEYSIKIPEAVCSVLENLGGGGGGAGGQEAEEAPGRKRSFPEKAKSIVTSLGMPG